MKSPLKLNLSPAFKWVFVWAGLTAAVLAAALSTALTAAKTPPKPLLINGAGASFPYILYSKWFAEYRKKDPSVMINYRSIGSGGGIRQFLAGTLDFGATDVPIPLADIKKHPQKFLQLPMALGAVVVGYNLPALKNKNFRLTANLLAEIYSKKITKWNDPKIQAINPTLALPNQNMIAVYRSDGSGTTAGFTEYLSLSKKWPQTAGKGKSVNWPTGIGGKGNEGVMGLIQKIPGAIGYIALSYASHRKIPTAVLQNQSGHFVKAGILSARNAAEYIWNKHHNLFYPLTTARGPNTYPLASYTYLLVPQKIHTPKGRALTGFLKWALSEGQSLCQALYYIPLPPAAAKAVLKQVKNLLPSAAAQAKSKSQLPAKAKAKAQTKPSTQSPSPAHKQSRRRKSNTQ